MNAATNPVLFLLGYIGVSGLGIRMFVRALVKRKYRRGNLSSINLDRNRRRMTIAIIAVISLVLLWSVLDYLILKLPGYYFLMGVIVIVGIGVSLFMFDYAHILEYKRLVEGTHQDK